MAVDIGLDSMPPFPPLLRDKLAEISQQGGLPKIIATLSALQAKKDEAQRTLLSNLDGVSFFLQHP